MPANIDRFLRPREFRTRNGQTSGVAHMNSAGGRDAKVGGFRMRMTFAAVQQNSGAQTKAFQFKLLMQGSSRSFYVRTTASE